MASPLHIHDTETTKSAPIGTRYCEDFTGRVYRYSENGGGEAGAGKLMVQAVHSTDHSDLAPAATAAGASSVTVTLGSTGITAGDFDDGWLNVQDQDGEGISYRIKANDTVAASGSAIIDLYESVTVALTTSTDVNLVKNLFKDVVISSTDQADVPAGVFNVVVAANAYGMIQTWGPAAVWQDDSNAIGDMLVTGTGVAGQVEVDDAAGEPLIGIQGPYTGAAADYQLVYLKIER